LQIQKGKMTMSDVSPDDRLVNAVVDEIKDCFEQYAMTNVYYLLGELLEKGVDPRRVMADFVREGLYDGDK